MPESLTMYEVGNGIAFLTMNNPRRRNALSFAMMDDMLGHLESAENDSEVRVVVIRAERAGVQFGARFTRTGRGRHRRADDFVRPMHGANGGRSSAAEAGNSAGARFGHRGRLPACGDVRPGGGFGGREFRHSGSGHRPVLHDAGCGARQGNGCP